MTTNQNFKPSEGKREEFRKYLEKNGVMDALTKVLVGLYEEIDKPEDALLFIRDRLAMQAGLETYAMQSDKIRELETRIHELEDSIAELTKQAEEAKAAEENTEAPEEVPPLGPETDEVTESEVPAPEATPEAPE